MTAVTVRHNRRVRTRLRSVAHQVLLLQTAVVVLLVVVAAALSAYDARRDARSDAVARSIAVARSVADAPTVQQAVTTPHPSTVLQPYAEQVRRDTGVDFVVIMGLDRTRFTHPDPSRIGGSFVGDLGSAPHGGVFTQQYTGTLGPSMRAVVPVEQGGKVVALVAVGITIAAIDHQLAQVLGGIAGAGLLVLGAGLLAAWLTSRRLRRQTHGLDERELTRMYEYHHAVLHAVREGLVLLDHEGRVQLVNDEARRLLGLPDAPDDAPARASETDATRATRATRATLATEDAADVLGRPAESLGLPAGAAEAAVRGVPQSDVVYVAGDKVLVVSSSPARWGRRDVGAVVTLRDRTELDAVTGQLDVVRGLTEALRAQNHESANRLHTVVSLIEMGRPTDAVEFATRSLASAQQLADEVVASVADPALAALLLGKSAEAGERGITLRLDGRVEEDRAPFDPLDLVTIVGNLVDNAFDAVAGAPDPTVEVSVAWDPRGCTVTVEDNGPGIAESDVARVLERGWSTKVAGPAGRGIGLALVVQVARRQGGRVDVLRSELGGARLVVSLRAAAPVGGTA